MVHPATNSSYLLQYIAHTISINQWISLYLKTFCCLVLPICYLVHPTSSKCRYSAKNTPHGPDNGVTSTHHFVTADCQCGLSLSTTASIIINHVCLPISAIKNHWQPSIIMLCCLGDGENVAMRHVTETSLRYWDTVASGWVATQTAVHDCRYVSFLILRTPKMVGLLR